jgi:exopolysaccharide biosynthesis polyprenyl glycosylphosphotransferase
MFAYYAFAFAIAAAGAAAASRFLLAPVARSTDDVLYRDSATAGVMGGPGSASADTIATPDLQAAVDSLNAPLTAGAKRLFDIVFALGLLMFLAPVILVAAVAVRLDGPGPILYRQRRIGYDGREFSVFKLRSMIVDAEPDGPRYASPNDARITRVGRLLRKFHIDEIPQAINVLRGEMSFVGPRPERPEFVRELEREIPNYHYRHMVKPGITGWAQVNYEYAASVEGARCKLRYDLYYIRRFSLGLDLLIVLMTVRVALFGLAKS